MFRLRNIAMRDYQESVTDGQTDEGQSDPYVPLCVAGDTKMVAAFQGMHVSPAKHSYAWLPRKCDYKESVTTGQTDRHTDRQTHRQTDQQTPDKVIPMFRFTSQATQKLANFCLWDLHAKNWLHLTSMSMQTLTKGMNKAHPYARKAKESYPRNVSNLSLKSPFCGEFNLHSYPNMKLILLQR